MPGAREPRHGGAEGIPTSASDMSSSHVAASRHAELSVCTYARWKRCSMLLRMLNCRHRSELTENGVFIRQAGDAESAEADSTAAIGLDATYVKAYQRRAAARQMLGHRLQACLPAHSHSARSFTLRSLSLARQVLRRLAQHRRAAENYLKPCRTCCCKKKPGS